MLRQSLKRMDGCSWLVVFSKAARHHMVSDCFYRWNATHGRSTTSQLNSWSASVSLGTLHVWMSTPTISGFYPFLQFEFCFCTRGLQKTASTPSDHVDEDRSWRPSQTYTDRFGDWRLGWEWRYATVMQANDDDYLACSVVTNTSTTVFKYVSNYCSLYHYLKLFKYPNRPWYLNTVWEYIDHCVVVVVVVVVVVEMNIIKVALSHFCCRTTVQSSSEKMHCH